MNFKHRRNNEPEVNITPLIDIVFLLLIFFMVSTTFKQEFEVGIDLPQASSKSEMSEKLLEIAIDRKGNFFVNREKLVNTQTAILKQAMKQAANGDLRIPIVISADSQTPHQAVIQAMDAARQLGFSRLTFATQQIAE